MSIQTDCMWGQELEQEAGRPGKPLASITLTRSRDGHALPCLQAIDGGRFERSRMVFDKPAPLVDQSNIAQFIHAWGARGALPGKPQLPVISRALPSDKQSTPREPP